MTIPQYRYGMILWLHHGTVFGCQHLAKNGPTAAKYSTYGWIIANGRFLALGLPKYENMIDIWHYGILGYPRIHGFSAGLRKLNEHTANTQYHPYHACHPAAFSYSWLILEYAPALSSIAFGQK